MPKRQDINKIMIIGSGPIIIGQACEFDYSGVQAVKALKEEGYRVVFGTGYVAHVKSLLFRYNKPIVYHNQA